MSTLSPAPKQARGNNRPRHRQSKSTGSSIAMPVPQVSKAFSQPRLQMHHTAPPQPTKGEGKKRRSRRSKEPSKDAAKVTPAKMSPLPATPIKIVARGEQLDANFFEAEAATQSAGELGSTARTTPVKSRPSLPKAGSSFVTPVKAYAGATFQHSPAPSSLPVPKFFSKSVPTKAPVGLQAMLEKEESSDGSVSPTSAETNLEKLFNADRLERERQRSDTSDTESQSSPSASDAGSPKAGLFRNITRGGRPPMEKAVSEPLFSMDMDSPSKASPSPKTVAPKTAPQTAAPKTAEHADMDPQLRRFLFQMPRSTESLTTSPSPVSRKQTSPLNTRSPLGGNRDRNSSFARGSPSAPQKQYGYPHKAPAYHQPSAVYAHGSQTAPYHAQHSAPAPAAAQPVSDIARMENDLRRILNLSTCANAPASTPVPTHALSGGVMI